MPGPAALRPAPGDREASRGARTAEDLRAGGVDRRVGRHALHRDALVGAPAGRSTSPTRPEPSSAAARARGRRSTGPGCPTTPVPARDALGDRVARRDARRRACCPATAASRAHPHRPAAPTRRRSRRTATARRTRRPISYTLTANANVAVTVLDAGGATVAELEPKQWRRAGARSVVFDGSGPSRRRVSRPRRGQRDRRPRGRRRRARDALRARSAASRSPPPALTPNGDGRDDALSLTVPAHRAGDADRAGSFGTGSGSRRRSPGAAGPGAQTVTWDGAKRIGKAQDGAYAVSVEAVDAVGTATRRAPVRPRRDRADRPGRLGGAAADLGLARRRRSTSASTARVA